MRKLIINLPEVQLFFMIFIKKKKNVPGRSNNKKKIDQKVADDKNDFTEVQGFFMLISHYKKCMKVDK